MKVSHRAARTLRSGHPWVFRDSLLRPLSGKEPGELVAVHDEDGRPLGWGLVEPEGAIAVRMVSAAEQFDWSDQELHRRLEQAVAVREAVLSPAVRSACRLVHGEGDGLPGLAVDRLGDFLLVYKYSRAAEAYLDRLVPILDEALSPAGIYMQDRVRGVVADERKPPAFHLRGKTAPPEIEVSEDELTFIVDVSAPVSPGLFLDLREGRRWAERLSPGRRVLNLFSFTGSFGVRAVRAGATRVVNVDAAARSHARCRQNLAASGLDPVEVALAWACAAGQGVALRAFESRYLAELPRMIGHMKLSEDAMAEVAQVTRRRLLVDTGKGARLTSYAGRGQLRALVRVVATRAALDLRRSSERRREVPVAELSAVLFASTNPENVAGHGRKQEVFRAAFEAAIAALPPADRTLLRMYAIDGVGIDGLAAVAGIHRSTAARRLARIRGTIADKTRVQLQIAGLREDELHSVIGVVDEGLELTLSRILADPDPK